MLADSSAFQTLFVRSRNGMLVADDERRYVAANSAACRLLGVSSAQLVGKRIDDFIAPEMAHGLEAIWRAFLEDGAHSGEYELVLPGGRRRRFEYSATARIEPGRHLLIMLTTPGEPDRDAGDQGTTEHSALRRLLSPREREVLTHLAAGATGTEIAEVLHISPETVRNHVRSSREKLDARTKAHAIALAIRAGEIPP